MKKNDCTSAATAAPTPADTRPGAAMRIPVVTQNQPDEGGHITPSKQGEAPTREELEQDVIATNPSVESMDSRG